MAHNYLTQFPDVSALASLKELRLNDNKVTQLAFGVDIKFMKLEILDVSGNELTWEHLAAIGRACPSVHQLHIHGNAELACDGQDEQAILSHRERVVSYFPQLRILDGTRFD